MGVDIEPVRAFDAVHGEREWGFVDRVMVRATHPRSLPRPTYSVNRTMLRRIGRCREPGGRPFEFQNCLVTGCLHIRLVV